MSSPSSSGYRRRQTRPAVRVAERVAKLMITIGGLGTIIAVTLIMVFLVWVVVPLFKGASYEAQASTPLPHADQERAPLLAVGVDEYRRLSFTLDTRGTLTVRRNDDGSEIERRALLPDSIPTAASTSFGSDALAMGFEDGSVRLVHIGFQPHFLDDEEARALAGQVGEGVLLTHENSVVELTNEGQLRAQSLEVELGEPLDLGLGARVARLDRSEVSNATRLVALDEQGTLVLAELRRRENMLTGETTVTATHQEVPWQRREGFALPEFVLLSGSGDTISLAWGDGVLHRYDARDYEHVALAEEVDLVEGAGTLDALTYILGKTTLISGDSRGRVLGWFSVRVPGAGTRDGMRFTRTHELALEGAPVTSLGASERSRVVVAGFADGVLRMYHVTSHKLLFETRVADKAPIVAIDIAPKEDGLFALSRTHLASWSMQLGHPEASLGALFTPVWYEGYQHAEHAWQSSSGTDDFEPKLGLVPLIFGTLKATFYAMLFGVPLALLAAIFTSEFLHPKLRAPLKSITELMASLPSVVLGFLAGIVIAPFLQGVVPTVLATFITLPLALLAGAHLWQLLPPHLYVRLSGLPRFVAMFLMLPVGLLLALVAGPWFERTFFAGDISAWLSGQRGTALGGWLLLLIPVAALIVTLLSARLFGPWLRRRSGAWTRNAAARFDLVKFVVAGAATFGLALLAAWTLDQAGFDARGGVLDTYVQRNALIVGFVMGFAVIPIIYTLAEDALSSVPSHLRIASLGAGATPWQTATRVVIPTAMSGLFSAVMIGLGRAVGETMIVLMATGNTAIMSWNVFDGFRTLSANIAVELPEAVKNSTHYRTLFLAALCLFALTFLLNTVAEVVRQRFRRRAYQL